MVNHPWSDFLTNQFTKTLRPTLGVDQEEHAPKVNVLIFKKNMSKNGNFEKFEFDHYFVLSSSSLSPKIISLTIYNNIISLPWVLAFFL